MKSKKIPFLSTISAILFIIAASNLCLSYFSEKKNGPVRAKAKFDTLMLATKTSAIKSRIGSSDFEERFIQAIGDIDNFNDIKLSINNITIYDFPPKKSESPSTRMSKTFSQTETLLDGNDISLDATLYTVKLETLYNSAKLSFMLVLVGTLIALISLCFTKEFEDKPVSKTEEKSNEEKLEDGLSEIREARKRINEQNEKLAKVATEEQTIADENIDNNIEENVDEEIDDDDFENDDNNEEIIEDKVEEESDEDIVFDDEINEASNYDETIEEENIEESNSEEETIIQEDIEEPQLEEETIAQENVIQEDVEPQIEEENVVQESAEPQIEEENVVQESVEPQIEEENVVQENAEPQIEEENVVQENAEPQIEEENIVQENVIQNNNEELADNFINDLSEQLKNNQYKEISLAMIKMADFYLDAEESKDRTQEILSLTKENFGEEAEVYEYSLDTIAVVLNGVNLETTQSLCESIFPAIAEVLGTSENIFIGISAMNYRSIPADRLIVEAKGALEHAESDPENPIVAFKANPELYKQEIGDEINR